MHSQVHLKSQPEWDCPLLDIRVIQNIKQNKRSQNVGGTSKEKQDEDFSCNFRHFLTFNEIIDVHIFVNLLTQRIKKS